MDGFFSIHKHWTDNGLGKQSYWDPCCRNRALGWSVHAQKSTETQVPLREKWQSKCLIHEQYIFLNEDSHRIGTNHRVPYKQLPWLSRLCFWGNPFVYTLEPIYKWTAGGCGCGCGCYSLLFYVKRYLIVYDICIHHFVIFRSFSRRCGQGRAARFTLWLSTNQD